LLQEVLDKYTVSVYYRAMHTIARPALKEFWKRHPDAEGPLDGWYRTMQREVFTDFNHLRATFPRADQVSVAKSGSKVTFTVFNIGGNTYRLITEIHYAQRVVLIRKVLTHADYDRGDWKRGN
jgi:mRNA interferase HigB